MLALLLMGWARDNDFRFWDSYACLSTRVARMRYLRDGWMVCVCVGGGGGLYAKFPVGSFVVVVVVVEVFGRV